MQQGGLAMNQDLFLQLTKRPIAFHRIYAKVGGSVNAGLLLSQAMYWNDLLPPIRKGWFYKTQAEWEQETCLTRREQEAARKALRAAGVLEEKLQGIPARLHFRVNLAALYAKMAVIAKMEELKKSSMAETAKLDCTKPPNLEGGNRQTIICTETSLREYEQRIPMSSATADGGHVSEALSPKQSKAQKLANIQTVPNFPSEAEFDQFIDSIPDGEYITEYRPDLYERLCAAKWHDWRLDRWTPIRNWKVYVERFAAKIRDDMPR